MRARLRARLRARPPFSDSVDDAVGQRDRAGGSSAS